MKKRIESLEAAALRKLAEAEGLERESQGESLSVGDLFQPPGVTESAIEWAVIEVEAATPDPDDRRCLVVPADTAPWIGTGDVEIPPSEPSGPLALRCRYSAWTEVSRIDPTWRSGVFPARYAEAALSRIDALEEGPVLEPQSRLEVDGESEYHDWCRTQLEPARAALVRGPRSSSRLREVAELRPPSPRSSSLPRFGALAASMLIGAALAWLFISLRSDSRPDRTVASASALEPVVNQRLVWLIPRVDAERSPAEELAIDSADPHRIAFVLETWASTPYELYRVELVDEEPGEVLWESDELTLQGNSEVLFALPPGRLPSGELRFRLFGLNRDPEGRAPERTLLETYRLRVSSAP